MLPTLPLQVNVSLAWKRGNATPIFIKGDKKQAMNYHTTRLTFFIVKLFEKIIRGKFVNFLESNDLIIDNQNGSATDHALPND